jgi:hypothetical protein
MLDRIFDFHQARDADVKPNTITLSAVIKAWSKSGDLHAGNRAEALLDQMQETSKTGDRNMSPNLIIYNSVISAWANSKSRLGAQRALAYLEHMKKRAAAGHAKCKPDKFTYKAVIRSWSNSDHPDARSTVKRLREEMSRPKKERMRAAHAFLRDFLEDV